VTLLVGPWILQSPLNAFIDTTAIIMLMFLSFLLVFCIFYLLASLAIGLMARKGSLDTRIRFRDMIPLVVFLTSSSSIVSASLFHARWAWSVIIASIVFLMAVVRMRSGSGFVPRHIYLNAAMITFVMWSILASTHGLSTLKPPSEYADLDGTTHSLPNFHLVHQRLKLWGGWLCTGVWASLPVLLFSACMRIDWIKCRSDSVAEAHAVAIAQYTLLESPKAPKNPFTPLLDLPKPYFSSVFAAWALSTLAFPIFATAMAVRPEAVDDVLINTFFTVAVAMPLMALAMFAMAYYRNEHAKLWRISTSYPLDEPEMEDEKPETVQDTTDTKSSSPQPVE